ncbi:MAG: nucleoid-associated protein [Phenylobacterium sp.]|jgi:nucleoid-associated protein
MELQQAIIHELVKEKKQKDAPDVEPQVLEGQLLDVESDAVKTLVDSILNIYGTKGNSSARGTFNKVDDYSFPKHVDHFIEDANLDFKALSIQAMACLKKASKDKNFATGGYLVFGYYKSAIGETILIAMVKKRKGITLRNLIPETVQEVDLSKLHQAVRINVAKYKDWSQQEALEEVELNSVNSYLSFVSPKVNEETSGYFIEAIGCTNAIADKQATKDVIAAVGAFFNSDEQLKPLKKDAKEEVASKLYEISKSDNPECSLDTVDAWVTAIIPEELQDRYANKFTQHANNEPFNVPSVFKSNSTEAKKGLNVKIGNTKEGWSLNLARYLLGTQGDATIQYDQDEHLIIIRDLSDAVEKNIRTALELDNEAE